jgi:uncharacterized protein YyaL (SSP411 family)
MRERIWAAFLAVCLASTVEAATPQWQAWSEAVFERARAENRFVLLDLEAVWCHWCHVMDRETYADPAVQRLLERHYITVRVDQDARPDLSRRYEEFGWPATIVFAPDGSEIVKRRGYIPPERFAALLQAIVDDPTPVRYAGDDLPVTHASSPLLADDIRKELHRRFIATHDARRGGFRQEQKFMDRDTVEYALMLAARGDVRARKMAIQTLDGSLDLLDPVWGGVYQYSTHGDWKHPHFEKILFVQADYLRMYSLAWLALGDGRYLEAARSIERYVSSFLSSPEGAFYASQDADLLKGRHSADFFALDDAGRRARGIPSVDRHLYARENGWMAHALTYLYAATGDREVLARAERAAAWALEHRRLPDGGFTHDSVDPAGPYLEDTLAMGRAFLGLYQVTGSRQWLAAAEDAARFVRGGFAAGAAGFVSAASDGVLPPRPQADENLMQARFANLLWQYTGKDEYREDAQRAMRYLVTREVALRRPTEAGILIADIELSSAPLHLTVIGSKTDPGARAMFVDAQRAPGGYKRIEWWDRAEGPLPNPDVRYPDLPRAAGFVCTDRTCSLPVFDGATLLRLATRLDR